MPSLKKIRHLPKPLVIVLVTLIKGIANSFKLNIIDSENFLRRESLDPVIYAFWHNRLISTSPLARKYSREKVSVLISQSRDGQYITEIIHAFGFQSIRGSSSKGGRKAVTELTRAVREGRSSLGITPDGPRGPKYSVQGGAIWVASQTGIPIIPVSVNTKRHWQLRSWDQTQIPKPFTPAELIIGKPLYIPENLESQQLTEYQLSLRNRLLEITHWD